MSAISKAVAGLLNETCKKSVFQGLEAQRVSQDLQEHLVDEVSLGYRDPQVPRDPSGKRVSQVLRVLPGHMGRMG